MADWVKTGQPVVHYYKVTVEFSDKAEPVVECWREHKIAVSAVDAWHKIEAEAHEAGEDWKITNIFLTPIYTPMPD